MKKKPKASLEKLTHIVERGFSAIADEMATKHDIADMATKQDIANMATKQDIANMATKQDIVSVEERLLSIEQELKSIKRSVNDLARDMDAMAGHAADIKELRSRIAAIERQLSKAR